MYRCFIFDLDQTILDTSKLWELRESRQWGRVFGMKHLTYPYPGIHKLFEDLKARDIPIAIATNSPAGYAKTLLNHHKIVDRDYYLVAYHDVSKHKPDPECLTKICNKFNLHKSQVLFIGDNDIDCYTARNARVPFLGTPWGEFKEAPASFTDYGSLISEISDSHDNSIIEGISTNPKTTLICQENNVLFLGYYVARNNEPCFRIVRKKLLDFKDDIPFAKKYWLNVIQNHLDELPKIDLVVRALGHDEELARKNRLDDIGQLLADTKGGMYKPTLLKKRKLEKSINLSKAERYSQIKGKYRISKPLLASLSHKTPQSILIIDDVFTTGATTNEITRALIAEFQNASIYIFTLTRTASLEASIEKGNQNLDLISQFNVPVVKDIQADKGKIKYPLVNKSLSANYCYSNSNFIIQNLPKFTLDNSTIDERLLASIYVIRNILCRGNPTLSSQFLQNHFGAIHQRSDFREGRALYSNQQDPWMRIFRESNRQNAAQIFYEQLLDLYLDEYCYVKGLILPEVKISEITMVNDEALHNQHVDFYLPQAFLAIEIDGPQHAEQREYDNYRDYHLNKYGITTIRISTESLFSENDEFKLKIQNIKNRIALWEKNGYERKKNIPSYISLSDYKESYINNKHDDSVKLATAVIRFQLLILELLEKRALTFESTWSLQIRTDELNNFANLAIEDLSLWFAHLSTLHGINFHFPKYEITTINSSGLFNFHRESIYIDFSLNKRYTDKFQDEPEVVYVRTHYLDQYKYFPNTGTHELESYELKEYDYFSVSSLKRINYPIDFGNLNEIEGSLLFLLKNIFLQNIGNLEFREGQLDIILNALAGSDTIGLLPTGSGKSVCYQLSAILQPAVSFVVCPIKSLMYDQKQDLDSVYFSRVNFITSDLKATEKSLIQSEYSQGKYFFIFIAPERFQSQEFRRSFSAINTERSLAYAVIDEVHCLSEWGHDFRTAYLNLSNAINRLASDTRYIGLTATASVNVLRDIQREFSINDLDVKTPSEYTRKELSFSVIDDQGDKYQSLLKCLHDLDDNFQFVSDESHSKCGLIFSATVNGKKGCYEVSNRLSNDLGIDVGFYSGSAPNNFDGRDFDSYKREMQNGFKENQFSLLIATKAFGMGVNKGNIYFTIHYGIPSSMESLYQEAGRAGRNKELFRDLPAECITLLGTEKKIDPKIWSPEITVDELSKELKSLNAYNDLSTNFFLFMQGIDPIKDDVRLLKELLRIYYTPDKLTQQVHAKELAASKQKTEKAIYRLSQLGIVRDWTVENFYQGIFEVEFIEYDDNHVSQYLLNYIQKYDPNFTFESIKRTGTYMMKLVYDRFESLDLYLLILLIWSYEHFAYNRRQSLKNVYENCLELSSAKITKERFKFALEDYFKFDSSSNLLQKMADDPLNPGYWYSIYFDTINNIPTDKFVNKRRLQQLRGQLSRFLESYMNSTGLNLSSGFIRLLLDEYDNPDGESRILMALRDIKNIDDEEYKLEVTDNLFDFASKLDDKLQDRFIDSFFKVFKDIPLLKRYEARLGNTHFTYLIMYSQVGRLKSFNRQVRSLEW